MSPRQALYLGFTISGAAGLMYEVVWTRYLGLYVGNSAYAQALVLAVFLGGLAVGSFAVADLSRRLRSPLRAYVAAEVVLAVLGLLFHPVFQLTSGLSYDALFPWLGSAQLVGAVRWGVAGLLILPQAVVLGTTFPFMAAGLVRWDQTRPGRGVASAYLFNTLGGATGVVAAGFVTVALVGLPGTLIAAAALNLGAAALVARAERRVADAPPGALGPEADVAARISDAPPAAPDPSAGERGGQPDVATPLRTVWAQAPRRLLFTLMAVTAASALASFAYEIGWIRLLALILGSATHAFELMLAAFILGLAGGAWAARERVDRSSDPVLLLARIQVGMGVAALLSLPVSLGAFHAMGALLESLPETGAGYAAFNALRFGLCVAVMLPTTVLAGATLPVITGTLLRAGAGERSIGLVYGSNTLGSVAGALAAGLLILPLVGLERVLTGAALVDVSLGVALLAWTRGPRPAATAAAAVGACALAVVAWVDLDPRVLASGVFRYATIPEAGARESLYYRDGRTASVSAHVVRSDGLVVLATNGKPDASLGARWYLGGRDTLPPNPIEERRDFTTQVLAPMVALAHAPTARSVANIGHGSGLSGAALLSAPSLERLVTVEIEPLMVEASAVFTPLNGPVFTDPRSTFVFDDARAYFAYRDERFDIVFSEPSNPWVSGVSGLFSREFYERVVPVMAPGGVLAQWVHLYEFDDDLFLAILAALTESFPHYRAYLVGPADVVIVSSTQPLPDPDWSVLSAPGFLDMVRSAPAFRPEHLDALHLFDGTLLRPLIEDGVRANSDFAPVVDLGADRARFENRLAEGAYSFAADRFDPASLRSGRSSEPGRHHLVPARGLQPMVDHGRAAWLREAWSSGGGIAPEAYPDWTRDLVDLGDFVLRMRSAEALTPGEWEGWARLFERAEASLHWGTSGWVDSVFYAQSLDFLARTNPPAEARAVADLLYGASVFDWDRAARGADLLVPRVAAGTPWVRSTVLLDVAVVAYLETGRPRKARDAHTLLAPRSGRAASNLRNRLLDAWIRQAGF